MSTDALELALALHQAPIQRFALRDRPLPKNLGLTIQIASSSQPQLSEAAARFSESEDTILEAVRFFLQQVLFEPGTDAYRVLGVAANADTQQIREHHVWLQRWLHPDRRGEDWEAVLATKVNWAWQQLRSDASRGEYDKARVAILSEQPSASDDRAIVKTPAWTAAPITASPASWLKRGVIGGLIACCAVLIYLASTRQDRVDLNGIAMQTKSSDSSIRPRIPFDAETEQPNAVATRSALPPAPLVEPSADVAETTVDRSDGVSPTSNVLEPAANSQAQGETALADNPDSSHSPKQKQRGVVVVPVKQNDVIAHVTPAAIQHEVAATHPGRSRPQASRHDEPEKLTPPAAKRVLAAVPRKPRSTEPSSTVTDQASIPSVAVSAPAASKAPSGSTPLIETRNERAKPPSNVAAIDSAEHVQPPVTPDEFPVPLEPLIAVNDPPSAIQIDQPATQAAKHATSQAVASENMLSRFELARQRVTTMVKYFGSQDIAVPQWGDEQGQRSVERERNAMQARNQPAAIDRFTVDTPQWRVSGTSAAYQATYHAKSRKMPNESGQFTVDMNWHDGDWKITRFEVTPSR